MAPFIPNISEIRPLEKIDTDEVEKLVEGGEEVHFQARIDDEWLVVNVPNGGYLVGLVMQAISLVQQNTPHAHPLWLSSQFIGPSAVGPCIITVKRIKKGKTSSNLVANLSQIGKINVQAQLVYGVLPVAKHPLGPFPSTPNYMTPPHPHPLSRRCPLVTHPSKCVKVPFFRPYTFAKHIVWASDPYYPDYMERVAHSKLEDTNDGSDMGKGGFVSAFWFDLLSPEDHIITQIMPFLADVSPDLVPKSVLDQAGGREPSWFPTLGLSADFKHLPPTPSSTSITPSMPSSSDQYGIQTRTVGVYIRGQFLIEGRQDMTVEIWTAPSRIGEGVEESGWRDRMYCMASVTQSAMTVPASVNVAKGRRLDDTQTSTIGIPKL